MIEKLGEARSMYIIEERDKEAGRSTTPEQYNSSATSVEEK